MLRREERAHSNIQAGKLATLSVRPAARDGWRALAEVIAAALMLMLAVAANRSPTVFTDSDDYFELGRQIVTGVADFVSPPPPHQMTEEERDEAAQIAEDRHMGHSQMASRSVAYALFLYPLERAGTLWLVTLVQALAVAAVVRVLWRAAVPDAPAWHYLAGMAVLTVATPLPFYAGFAMPDVFAGLALAGIVLLTVYWSAVRPAVRWSVAVLLVFAVAVHTSHFLLGIVLLPIVMLLLWRVATLRRSGAAMLTVAAALAAAWGLNAAYIRIDQMQTGELLRHQPFLTARVLADGPGRTYLRRACATAKPYVLCRFAHEPLDDSEEILWSDREADGVFLRSDYATRLALEDEEPRFVAAVIADDPLGTAAAALRNWGQLLLAYQVEEPVHDPHYYLTDEYWKDTFLPEMILGANGDCGPAQDRCGLRLTPAASRVLHGTTIALAIPMIAVLWWRRGTGAVADRRLDVAVALLLVGVLLNAAICGILSGPFARYESRIVWLVPFAALLLLSASLAGRNLMKPVPR